MSIEAEFIVQTESFQHVKVTVRGENVGDLFTQMASITEGHREILGDYWASLKAAVLYGRDKALLDARLAAGIEQAKAGETKDLGDFSQEEDPEEGQEDPVKLLTEELGAIVLEVTEKPQEGPSSPSGLRANGSEPDAPARPWKNKLAAKKTKAWEDPVTEGPDATPEESVTATKAARKAATASEWDW